MIINKYISRIYTPVCRTLTLASAGGLLIAAVAHAALAEEPRAWGIAESIAFRYVVTDQGSPGYITVDPRSLGPAGREPVKYSPSGDYFFFVVRHGDTKLDQNIYELLVFETSVVKKALNQGPRASRESIMPFRRVSLGSGRSAGSHAAISRAQWTNSSTIVFCGVEGLGQRGVYRLDVNSGNLLRLTSADHDVEIFEVHGDSVLYNALFPSEAPPDRYPAFLGGSVDMWRMISMPSLPLRKLYYQKPGKPAMCLWNDAGDFGYGWDPAFSTISPDGKWALVNCFRNNLPWPQKWKYDRASQMLNRFQFILFNLVSGQSRELVDAPSINATQVGFEAGSRPDKVFWSADSRSAIVIHTSLPLRSGEQKLESDSFIVAYNVNSGETSVLESLAASVSQALPAGEPGIPSLKVDWVIPGKSLLVRHTFMPLRGENVLRSAVLYRWNNNQWGNETIEPASGFIEGLQRGGIADFWKPQQTGSADRFVFLKEDENTPPNLVAVSDGQQLPLLPSDPAIAGVWQSRISLCQWQEKDGTIGSGQLLMPRRHGASEAVPLVIQCTPAINRELFLPDGSSPTAFAAQSLVGQGMAVLFVEMTTEEDRLRRRPNTPAEGETFVRRIDAAVDHLVKQGLVDGHRVGLIGFSRGGYLVKYAVTHPGTTKLAAAIAADGWDGGYYSYITQSALNAFTSDLAAYDRQNGGNNFWADKESWLKNSPDFNLDRVTSPLLLTANLNVDSDERGRAYYTAGFLGGLRLLRRPFDVQFIPRGGHQLQTPRERQSSLQCTLDWFGFWLKGQQPEDPERAARWAVLRKQQDEVLKTPPPPKGKWVFQADPVQPEWHPPVEPKKEKPKAEPTGANKN